MKKLQSIFSTLILTLLIIGCSNDSDNLITEKTITQDKSSNPESQKSKEDEITYQKLTKYLKKRNLEFCSFSDQIEKMEIECIHKADALYPDFGMKHNEYVEELTTAEIKKLGQKHNIADSVFTLIAILSITYCH